MIVSSQLADSVAEVAGRLDNARHRTLRHHLLDPNYGEFRTAGDALKAAAVALDLLRRADPEGAERVARAVLDPSGKVT